MPAKPGVTSPHRAALMDALPMILGMVPFAIAIGVAIDQSALPAFVSWLGAPLVFAGSAHLAMLSMLDSGVAAPIAVAAALIVNLRFAVYGASLSPLFERQPQWFRLVAPQLIVDQTFALLSSRQERHEPGWMRAYFLTIGIAGLAMWCTAMAVGVALGPVLPEQSPLQAAAPLMVAALLGGSLRSRRAVAVALIAFGTAIVLSWFTTSLAILGGGLAGIVASRIRTSGRRTGGDTR